MASFSSFLLLITLSASALAAVFTSGTPDATTNRPAYFSPSLTFSSNEEVTIQQFSQYLNPSSGTNFNAVVLLADVNSNEILFTSDSFQLISSGQGWYNSPTLNWNLPPSNSSKYSISFMVDTPALYFYTVAETDTDSTLTSYFTNGNFQGSFSNPTFSCCGEINLYSTITYETVQPPPPGETTFTAGGSTSYTSRSDYEAPGLGFTTNIPVFITQVSNYLYPTGVSTGQSFQGMIVIADLQQDAILFTSPVFNLTNSGVGWYNSPSFSFEIFPNTTYGAAIMINTDAYYYYNSGTNTDGTLSSTGNNANFNGYFTYPSVSCCGYGNIYTQIVYTGSQPQPSNNGTTFTSGNSTTSTYRSAYNPAALNFQANTNITLTQVSQWLGPTVSIGAPFGAMVVVANLNTSSIVYNSPVFTLYGNGTGWYTSPSFSLSLAPNTNYGAAIMLNVSTYIYYSLNYGNSDGTITSYAANANFNGNFFSQSIDCCYHANIYTQLSYTASAPAPPTNQYTFVSGGTTYTNDRSSFYAAALTFTTLVPVTLQQVSQYITPDAGVGSQFQGELIIAQLYPNTILYNSPVFTVANNGSSWYSAPPISFTLSPNVNYAVGIMFNVGNTIYYTGQGNTDGIITSTATNANFQGGFANQTIQCCYGANIYTELVYSSSNPSEVEIMN